MADNPINPIGRADLEGIGRMGQTESAQVSHPGTNAKPKSVDEAGLTRLDENQKNRELQVEPKAEKPQNPMDIALKFMIDEKTQDVTIFILNKATHEVVRTIPPEDMNKLSPGELLEMFA